MFALFPVLVGQKATKFETVTLHKKMKFSMKISSVNVIEFGHIY